MEEYIEIGKIVNTHGVKGEVKVIPLTDDPQRFLKLKKVYIEKASSLELTEIEEVKFNKNMVILRFKGIEDMNGAEALRDCYIKVDRKNAVKLPKDSFFIFDLIDCTVVTEEGVALGILKDVLKTGSNDVYSVRNAENKEILIPALKSVIKDISINDKRIIVKLPEGLVDHEI